MKIFLGNPPWRPEGRLGVRAGSRWPFTIKIKERINIPLYVPFPFFLAYAASLLKKSGFSVLLTDAIAEGLSEEVFLKKITDFQPDIVLFETSTPSIDNDLKISRKVKDKVPAKIILCGPHVSVLKEKIIKDHPFIDYILAGEYEFTLLDLAKSLHENRPFENISGLVYRVGTVEIKVNPRRPIIKNLDDLPWPERNSLPMGNYNDAFCGLPTPSLQMWTSRGCPYQCIFCLWPAAIYGGSNYRTRSPEDVVNEMQWCTKNYGFKSVYFDDDTFNIKRDHVLGISREIRKRNLRIDWAAMCRADNMDREMLEEMKASGLYAVKYGVESGAQEIIDNCNKKLDLRKVKEIVKVTKVLGIKVHLTFTFGLPGETKETIKETSRFALELGPDSAQVSLATPFPGTVYFRIAQEKGLLLTQDWSKYDGADSAVIRTEKLSREELEKAVFTMNKLWAGKRFCNPVRAFKRLKKYFQKPLTSTQTCVKFKIPFLYLF